MYTLHVALAALIFSQLNLPWGERHDFDFFCTLLTAYGTTSDRAEL